MKVYRKSRKWLQVVCVILSLIMVCGLVTAAGSEQAKAANDSSSTASLGATDSAEKSNDAGGFEPYYRDVLADWLSQGFQAAKTEKITIKGKSYSALSENSQAAVESYAGKSDVLVWKSEKENWVEYELKVPSSGLYTMNLNYYPYDEPDAAVPTRRSAVLSVQVDGNHPYREARSISFRRLFADEMPIKQDENGDDIRPQTKLLTDWLSLPFQDSQGAYSEPLQWYFTAGTHKLRLSSSDSIAIDSIVLSSPEQLPTYEQYSTGEKVEPQSDEVQIIQAEQMTSKNDVSIQIASDSDPLTVPHADGKDTFNTVGGERWKDGGQTINWTFTAPADGHYKIGMRAYQGYSSNMTVFRTIAIDGKVPFQQLLAYPFRYSPSWQGVVLGEQGGDPYEIYLTAGEHVLSMTATIAPFQPVIVSSDKVLSDLKSVSEELRSMTGGVVDNNRTWNIVQDYAELPKKLESIRDELGLMAKQMKEANGRRDNVLQTIESAADDIARIVKYPNEIPYHIDRVASLYENIGSIRTSLAISSLKLDQLYVAPVQTKFPRMKAKFFQSITGSVKNFFYSFQRKNAISAVDDNVLQIWVNRGRDYVNELQQLADQQFTPQYGIKVNVNLLPNEQMLILSNAAGLSPDLALGLTQDKPVDFAMRNALVDFSQFADFDQLANTYAPGSTIPYYYNGGYYGLPETQSFKVLFYRKDILKKLGIEVPNTWDQVYELLPTLQQSGYNFYVPTNDFPTFFYQNGSNFFKENGLSSDLNSPASFSAFKQWTDLFNIYGLEREVPSFYQHFRQGDMPMGIADFNNYIQLVVAAPELAGWWGIAPLPGIEKSDGTVERWASGGQTAGVIFKKSDKQEESWEFMKWWLSSDIQEQYGSNLESFNGAQFRWNTANIDAFSRLPWVKEDLKVILEQWKWYRELPYLPGSYYLVRELNNAWNRTVVDGMNFRESLEQGMLNVDREMLRKTREFGFVDDQNKVIRTLDLPQINEPWKGVDRYVTD